MSGDSFKTFTRKDLHDIIRTSTEKYFDRKFTDLEDKLVAITKCPPTQLEEFRKIINNFKIVYKRHWQACKSTENRFLEKHNEWLQQTIDLPCSPLLSTASSKGRPSKEFSECSERSKRRKTMDIRKNVPFDQLTYAAEMSNRAVGNKDAAKLLHDIQKSPSRASKVRKAVDQQTTTKKHSPEEALRIFIEANLTKAQYEVIQRANKDVYPCYTLLQKAKQETYPPKIVSETEAEVKLQDLVDNTALRLHKYLEDVIDKCPEAEKIAMTLTYKWGCDGSQQTRYKQKFQNDEDSDASVFISSIVPLRLTCGTKIIWQNPTPSSPRFCRPIRMRFVKENKDVTNDEFSYIEGQASKLEATTIADNIKISHTLLPTMIDGKVCNAATNTTSTMRCYVCGRTQKTFNDLSTTTSTENPETFKFGLSILHARIRFFEFLIHLSYKLKANIHKGRMQKQDKSQIEAAKVAIQKSFEERMGLLVDIPKAGYGNTNDGNTSRRFFSDIEVAADITGINIELIQRFRVILEVISSGFDVDTEKLGKYTMDTAKFYVELYPWQPMSPTVHKILMHAPSVIEHALLPIGQLSEEASEARNKHFRQYRESYSRKFSRKDCMEDVMNRLLLTSDPYFSSIRPRQNKKKLAISQEALIFFKSPCAEDGSDDDDNN